MIEITQNAIDVIFYKSWNKYNYKNKGYLKVNE